MWGSRYRWRGCGLALALVLGLAGLAQAREVRVGVYPNEPKIYLNEAGHATGIFADLLGEIATREGWTLRYVPCDWQA